MTAVKNGHVVEVPTAIWAEGRGTRSLGIIATSAADTLEKVRAGSPITPTTPTSPAGTTTR